MLMTDNMEYVIICSRIQRPFPIGVSFIKDESQRQWRLMCSRGRV